GRHLRHRRLPHGVLPGSGRERADAAPPLRAVRRRHDPVAMRVEHVDFVSVLTQDLQRAKQFYVETLGLEVETEGDADMELRCGQVTLDVFAPSSIGQPFAPSPAGIALRVADVDAVRAELEAKGVAFDGDTITTGVCMQTWFKDADGNALMLHRRFDARRGATHSEATRTAPSPDSRTQ